MQDCVLVNLNAIESVSSVVEHRESYYLAYRQVP